MLLSISTSSCGYCYVPGTLVDLSPRPTVQSKHAQWWPADGGAPRARSGLAAWRARRQERNRQPPSRAAQHSPPQPLDRQPHDNGPHWPPGLQHLSRRAGEWDASDSPGSGPAIVECVGHDALQQHHGAPGSPPVILLDTQGSPPPGVHPMQQSQCSFCLMQVLNTSKVFYFPFAVYRGWHPLTRLLNHTPRLRTAVPGNTLEAAGNGASGMSGLPSGPVPSQPQHAQHDADIGTATAGMSARTAPTGDGMNGESVKLLLHSFTVLASTSGASSSR